jgi:hypothetical protein
MSFKNVFILIILVSFMSFYTIFYQDMQWDKIYLDDIINVNSQITGIDSQGLGLMRLFFYLIIFTTCIVLIKDPEGLRINIYQNSKIVQLHLLRWDRFTMFTVWCWVLQGFYFGLSSYLVLLHNTSNFTLSINKVLYCTCVVLYEVSFSLAFLVTSVVTFILIPFGKSKGLPIDNFFRPLPLMMHNLNVLFVSLDMILNKVNFFAMHFPFVVMIGISYVIFSWYWYHKKGIFYYFFLDYNEPRSVLWHSGLLIAVALFFFAGSSYSFLIQSGTKFSRLTLFVFTFFIMKVSNKSYWDYFIPKKRND